MKPADAPVIVHIDIDAFFASVEKRIYPVLRNRPVAVGTGCIASCCYEARRWGLHAGMSLGEARKKCPRLVVMPGSHGIYRCFTDRIWSLCREFAPAVETHLDDAYLDLTGAGRLYRDIPAAVESLRARIRHDTGLTVSAGVGPNRMIARLAGKIAKPDGLTTVAPEEVEAFLIDRPVKDIPGIGPRVGESLARLNVHTVRELRMIPREGLEAIFGRNGSAFYDRARGLDTRPVSAAEVPRTISRETSFHKETSDPEEIAGTLHYLVERALKPVREFGLLARTLAVRIRYMDYIGDDGRATLRPATDLEGPVFDAAMELLRRLHSRRVALRLVGVELSGLSVGAGGQASLFEEDESGAAIARALDDVRGRFGFSAITAGRSIELLGRLRRDANGFVLRTPCLTK